MECCVSRFARCYEVVAADIADLDGDLNSEAGFKLSRHYYNVDEQGSTVLITDGNQSVKNEYWYDAFGNVLESKEQVHNRITYTGQQFDGITGQYYLRARFYNPVIGRFTQEDLYRGDGLNLYAYCGNNPVAYYDPSGYVCEPDNSKENNYNKTVDKYFPSERAARRAAYRDAGIGKHGGKTPLDEYLNSGSKHPYGGNKQSRNSWLSEKGNKVAHDKYGHKSNPTAKPHYNVYFKDGRDYHYYYPTDYDPSINI